MPRAFVVQLDKLLGEPANRVVSLKASAVEIHHVEGVCAGHSGAEFLTTSENEPMQGVAHGLGRPYAERAVVLVKFESGNVGVAE